MINVGMVKENSKRTNGWNSKLNANEVFIKSDRLNEYYERYTRIVLERKEVGDCRLRGKSESIGRVQDDEARSTAG